SVPVQPWQRHSDVADEQLESDQLEDALPDGWSVVAIRDVVEINPGRPSPTDFPPNANVTFVPMPSVDADAGAIISPQIRTFAEVRRGFTAFRDEDVILAKITPCFENGKVAVCR